MKTIDPTTYVNYDKALKEVRRFNYRMNVIQNGGKFIEVKDFDEEQRRKELEKIIDDRLNGYSGFDEYDDDGRTTA